MPQPRKRLKDGEALPRLRRELRLDVKSVTLDKEARTLDLSFSSEAPVDRWFGTEILSHDAGAPDFSRLNNGAPLLFNHNMNDLLGVVERAWVDGATRVGRCTVRFGKDERGQWAMQQVEDGILSKSSFMYDVDHYRAELDQDGDEDDTYTATKWCAYEVSLVTVPADDSVGVGRSDAGAGAAHRVQVSGPAASAPAIPPAAAAATTTRSSMIRAIAQQLGLRFAENADDAAVRAAVCQKLNLMDAANDASILAAMGQRAAAEATQTADAAAKAERERVAGIEELGKRHNLPGEMVRKMVTEGTKIELARGVVLEYIASRGGNASVARLGDDANPDLSEPEKGRYSLLRAIQAWLDGDWKKAGFERECSEEIGKRSGRGSTKGFYMPTNLRFAAQFSRKDAEFMQRAGYSVTSANAGGALVAQQLLAGSFIELLRNKAKVLQAGARILAGLVGNIDIPRQKSAATAYWLGDGANPTESEAQFELVGLTPKTVGAYSLITRNMLLQSTPDIEMLARADMLAIIALAIDLAALSGSGAGGQPQGIANTPGIGSVVGGTNGAQFTLDNFIDLETQVTQQNVPEDAFGYIINAKTIGWLKKQKSSTGQYLWNGPWNGLQTTPDFRPGSYPLNNFPAFRSNQARSNLTKGSSSGICSEAFFGDWSELLIGEWGVLEILPNPYGAAYQQGGIELRALQSIDVAPRHPVSFAVMSDGLTA